MTAVKQIQDVALSLPEAHEQPHFDKTSFRVGKRIFATLDAEAKTLVLKIPVDDQEVLLQSHPDVFATNAWSAQGWLEARVAALDPDMLREVLEDSWRRIAPKRAIKALEESRS